MPSPNTFLQCARCGVRSDYWAYHHISIDRRCLNAGVCGLLMISQGVVREVSSRESRVLDRNAEYLGVSTLQLMENAGKAVSDEVSSRFKPNSKIVVFAGTGRNGGDGMVATRHLASCGFHVTLVLVGAPSEIRDEATSINWQAINAMSETVTIEVARDSSQISSRKCDVVVDALLGTGARGPLRQPIARAVETINEMKCFKVAVDMPTGIDSDTGGVLGEALNANLTITFHARKPGLRLAKKYCGEVKVAGIGIPPEAENYAGPGDVEDVTTPRFPESHKGDFGRLLVIRRKRNLFRCSVPCRACGTPDWGRPSLLSQLQRRLLLL